MRTWGSIALVMLSAGIASAGDKLAVLPMQAKRVDQGTVEILDDLLVNEVSTRGGFTVIGAQDINGMLGLEKMKQALGCDSVTCAAEIGGALGVDLLLTGVVSVLGDEVIVSLSLVDTKAMVAKARAQARAPNDERSYAYAVGTAVARLLGQPEPAPPAAGKSTPPVPTQATAFVPPPQAMPTGTVTISTNDDGPYLVAVRSALDGTAHPCPEQLPGRPCAILLPAGTATIELTDGTMLLTKDVEITAGSNRPIDVQKWNYGGGMPYAGITLFVLGAGLAIPGLLVDNDALNIILPILGGSLALTGGIMTIVGFNLDPDYYFMGATDKPLVLAPPPPAVSFGAVPVKGGMVAVGQVRF